MKTMFVVLAVLSLFLIGCTQYGGPAATATPTPGLDATVSAAPTASAVTTASEKPAGLANPASTHCVNLGYELKIVESAEGQAGICSFGANESCEEWAFLRGECGQAFNACAKAGGRLGAVMMGPNGTFTSNSTCQFKDGTICEESDLADGSCRAGQQVA